MLSTLQNTTNNSTFTVTEAIVIKRNSPVKTGFRRVPGAPELTWILHVYPLGTDNKSDYVVAYLWVIGGSTTAVHMSFHVEGGKTYNYGPRIYDEKITKTKCYLQESKTLRSSDAVSTINCTFEFRREIPPTVKLHELIDTSKPHSWDVKLMMGDNHVKVHRGFLSMISPVFHAMFLPGTKKFKSGIIVIRDFCYVAVNNAINYCYGGDLRGKPLYQVIDMLRFYDKYDIQAPIEKLETWLQGSLSVQNFAPIANYSWQFDRVHLQRKCGRVFHLNKTELACHPTFVALEATTIAGVLKAGHAYAMSQESLIARL